MAIVIQSDEKSHFAPTMRRSRSQPKFGAQPTGLRQSSSASRISDVYRQSSYQQHSPIRNFSGSPDITAQPSPRMVPVPDEPLTPVSTVKSSLVPSLRLPEQLERPSYDSSSTAMDDGTDDAAELDVAMEYAHYDGVSFFNAAGDLAVPHGAAEEDAASPNDNNTLSTGPSRTNSSDFDIFDHIAEDDTAIRVQPSRHVDYLSHNWKEEDIWESWKYIVSRRGDYSNSARLENASWRTWMKSKNKLKTITPETLNWLKDCDVTWLYGPLQTGHQTIVPEQTSDSVELTKTNSFLASQKKPILKKRSMSELMLQRSLSASSLVMQAAAAVQAQQKDKVTRRIMRPRLERAVTDFGTFPFSSRRHSPGASQLQSTPSSGVVSPSSERRHIHFNEQVEQCIVVEVKGEDDEDDLIVSRFDVDSSDSDDGAIMMKRTALKRRVIPATPRRRQSHPVDSKTIAMLPSTTLKAQEDDLDILEGSAMKHSYRSPVMSPSSSQETLRPAKPSGRFFTEDDDTDTDAEQVEQVEQVEEVVQQEPDIYPDVFDEEEEVAQVEQQPEDSDGSGSDEDSDDGFGMAMGGAKKRTGGLLGSSASTSKLSGLSGGLGGGLSGGGGGGLKRTTSTSSLAAEPSGMRRTASGMFMPYEEGGSSRLMSSLQRRHR